MRFAGRRPWRNRGEGGQMEGEGEKAGQGVRGRWTFIIIIQCSERRSEVEAGRGGQSGGDGGVI